MATTLTQLFQVQVGKESTWGTAVTQVRQLTGVESCRLIPNVTVSSNKQVGNLAPASTGANITMVNGRATMRQRLSYDEVGILFDSLFATATPSGAGPYTYTYTAPLESVGTRSFYTLCRGNSSDAHSLLGALVSRVSINAQPGDYVMADVDFVGAVVDNDTLDSVAAETSVSYILPQHATISVGDYGGSLTALGCSIVSLNLEIDMDTQIRHGVGTLIGCDYHAGNPTARLQIVGQFSSSALRTVAEAMLGSTAAVQRKEFRLLFSNGTHSLQVDISGFVSVAPELAGDNNGAAILTFDVAAEYDDSTNLTSWVDVTVICDEATLPT